MQVPLTYLMLSAGAPKYWLVLEPRGCHLNKTDCRQEYPDLRMKPRSGITDEEWDYFLHIEDASLGCDVLLFYVHAGMRLHTTV